MSRKVILAGQGSASGSASTAEDQNPENLATEVAARDFVLTSKKGWRRGVGGAAILGGCFFPGGFAAVLVGVLLSPTGVGAAVSGAAGVAGLLTAAFEAMDRKDQAKVFKTLFEKDDFPKQDEIANQAIAAMNLGINTDQFIGVINSLLEKKEVSADLKSSIKSQEYSECARSIRRHYTYGYEEKDKLDDKAVLQFLLLKSVVDKLEEDRDLLPEVDRGILSEKFGEFANRFFQHCETRYPEKLTPKIRSKISEVLEAHGYANRHSSEVRDWASGELDSGASAVVEMIDIRPVVAEGGGDQKGSGGGGGERIPVVSPLMSPREARAESVSRGGAEEKKDDGRQ